MQNKITSLLTDERERLFLWLPLMVAPGVWCYFAQASEPSYWAGVAAVMLALALLRRCWRRPLIRLVALAILFMVMGFAAAQWRTARIDAPVLDGKRNFALVRGQVAELVTVEKGSKMLLSQVTIDDVPIEHNPKRVRITLKKGGGDITIGDWVEVKAGLFPPPQATLPGKFDFARHFYFEEIGAVGFSVTPPTRLEAYEQSHWDAWWAKLRRKLDARMALSMQQPAHSVGAALITGETRTIPESVNEQMRQSGLYHILAVSGMNLALASGIVFFALRYMAACIPWLAVRVSSKKIAAIGALAASFFYLMLAGAPISAQRAFVMIALLFMSVLLDRRVDPMRSLVWAAAIILLIEPESLLSAGFHLSFAATMGLIALYDRFGGMLHDRRDEHILTRAIIYVAAVATSSLVAGLATAPFIIYHFNQFSSYSLLANMLVTPLVSFIMMPAVIIGLLLMPFGLDWIGWWLLEIGVKLMLSCAEWVASLPNAMMDVPSLSDGGLAMVVLGGLWLCLWKKRWRLFGLPVMFAGMASMLFVQPPDVMVSGDGSNIAVHIQDGRLVMLEGRGSKFATEDWLKVTGQSQFAHWRDMRDTPPLDLRCDADACLYRKNGKVITVLFSRDALAEECMRANLVLARFSIPKHSCKARYIDYFSLRRAGAHAIWVEKGDVVVKTVRQAQGRRPWSILPEK